MISTTIVLGLLAVATVTDVLWRKIYNWTCYPGILIGLALSGIATTTGCDVAQGNAWQRNFWGVVPIADSLAGVLACGLAMLACYVFFAGAVGGGDVKLIAMIGAFLGTSLGLEAMLWTFVLGGVQALVTLIWRHGAVTVIRRGGRFLWYAIRSAGRPAWTDEDRQPLKTDLFLSPSALLAVAMVKFGWVDWIGGR